MLRGADGVEHVAADELDEVVAVAVQHGGTDVRHRSLDRLGPGEIGGAVHDAAAAEQRQIVLLALRHGVAGGHDLVLLDVDHGVLFHQLGVVLHGHEIGGLAADVQQQGEGGVIVQVLQLAVGAGHGGVLRGAGAGVKLGLLGALVGEDEADVGLVPTGGGDAGVDVHVVSQGDVVVALGGDGHVPLTEEGVEKAVVVHPVVVVLGHDELGVVEVIHPGGDLLAVLALPGDGVDQHRAPHVRAAEEADGLDDPGTDPVGRTLLVHLHHRLVEDIGGVVEPQVAVQVPAQMLGGGVLDALVQPLQLHVLGDHIHDQIGGQTVGAVGEPLDDVGVHQGGDAHRAALVVDLGVVLHDLELADHIAELAQLPVPQPLGGVLVQHGDLVVADLVHVGGEVPDLKGQQLRVGPGPEKHAAGETAHQSRRQQGQRQEEGDGALLLQKLEVVLDPLPLKAGGEHGADAVHRAQQKGKDIELRGLETDGRQLQIKVEKAENEGDSQIDEQPLGGRRDALAGLFLPGRLRGLGRSAAVEALPLEAPGVGTGKSHTMVLL